MSIPVFILVAGLLFFPEPLTGQPKPKIRFEQLLSENFKIEKGLSQNSVNCIWQDKTGYMWFGTWDGLNKYDGYSFTVYRAGYKINGTSLSNQTINTIFEDSRGALWIGTEVGLNYFDRKSQTFTYFLHDARNPNSISSDSILCINEDGMGRLWVGTRNGLNRYDPKTGEVRHYNQNITKTNSLSNNTIRVLLFGKDGKLYIGTDKGLNILDLKTETLYYLFHKPDDPNSLSDDRINALVFDRQGQLWIGTNNGLDCFNFTTQKFKHYYHNPKNSNSLSHNVITSLLLDSDGNLWIGTNGGGLNLYDFKNDNFTNYTSDPNNFQTLSNDYITTLYEDRSGIIWVGTAWRGVNKINRNQQKFEHYQHLKDNPNSLNNNIVWSIFQDENHMLWVGTDNGINIIDRDRSAYKFITHNPDSKNTLVSNQIRAIYKDSRGYIWIGTYNAGLSRYDIRKGTFRTFQNNPSDNRSLSDNNEIISILEDKSGALWIATNNGLNRYDYKTEKFDVFRNIPGNPNSLSHSTVLSLTEDRKGNLWISTYYGLNILDKERKNFRHLFHNPEDVNSLSSNHIFSVTEARDGTLWIATMGGGLNKYNPKTGSFKYYTESDGLANNVVYNIFEDKHGNLWMSTNNGISKFDPVKETFVNYDIKDGVQSSEFNLGACFHDKITDEMFFGGMNGFNSFFPEKIKSNMFIPHIVISSFRVFDKVHPSEFKNGDTIRLSYFDNFFSFEFSALDYSNPYKNKYAYKLENFDKDWIYCDAYKRFAGYTNVSPGTYVFRVRGSNSDGVWNNEGISVVLIIAPAWWSTWWFRISLVVFMVALVWYFVYSRLRIIRIRHEDEKRILEIEKQMFNLEQTALRLQINPHFIFNSLNSIQSFIVANDTDKAIHYLAKFAQLMRLILSNSHQTFVPISDEIRAISYYLDIEKLRFDNKFDYKIIIDPQIDTDFIDIPPMIIQPYIENAILHGILHKKGKGNILIEMKLIDNSLLCIVEDDGIGREKSAQIKAASDLYHKSRGMLITQKRLELLNKQNKEQMSVEVEDLKDVNGNARGTRVKIMITYKEG